MALINAKYSVIHGEKINVTNPLMNSQKLQLFTKLPNGLERTKYVKARIKYRDDIIPDNFKEEFSWFRASNDNLWEPTLEAVDKLNAIEVPNTDRIEVKIFESEVD